MHDPTTLNQQGGDHGTQYRSVIFYHNDEQKAIASEVLKHIDASNLWSNPVVTAIEPISELQHRRAVPIKTIIT